MRRVHKLKTVAPFYQALQDGVKTFEVRYDDRAYRAGDFLHLCEWDGEKFTGRNVWRRVSYVLSSGQFAGLAPGYVCMGFGEPLDYETTARLIGAAPEESALCPCGSPMSEGAKYCSQYCMDRFAHETSASLPCVWRDGCRAPAACAAKGHCDGPFGKQVDVYVRERDSKCETSACRQCGPREMAEGKCDCIRPKYQR